MPSVDGGPSLLLESISPDEKLSLLLVGDSGDGGPPACGEDEGRGTLKMDRFDKLDPVLPKLIVDFLVSTLAAVHVVDAVSPLDVPAAPKGLVWPGRIETFAPPRRGFCLGGSSSGGGDSSGDFVTWKVWVN